MRTGRRLVAFVAASLVFGMVSGAAGTAHGITYDVAQLSSNAVNDTSMSLSGDRIVWEATGGSDGGTDGEIFTWTPAGGTVQITRDIWGDRFPRVSGDRIVWQAWREGGSQIFTWTPAGTVQLTTSAGNNVMPDVSGDRVVWHGNLDGQFTWTPTDGIVPVAPLAFSQDHPRVSGDRIVWTEPGGTDSGNDREVFTWTPSTGVAQVTENGTEDVEPCISGDRIVWQAAIGIGEIMTWTPDGTVHVSYPGTGFGPAVSGDRIIWRDNNAGIVTWTPAGGVARLIASTITSNPYYVVELPNPPSVSGDRVVWSNALDGADTEIFMWTPAGGTIQLTGNGGNDIAAAVSASRIAWLGTRGSDGGSDYEVFTSTAKPNPMPVYRFYNFTNNTHFYTADPDERAIVLATWPHIFREESSTYSLNPANNTAPLYRFYNHVTKSHFYTVDPTERAIVNATWPHIYRDEGAVYMVSATQVPNSIPVYRFFNKVNGSHFYTASAAERDIVNATWPHIYRDENVGFYAGQ